MRNEVNRASQAKKSLRYLLMVVAMVSVLSVKAQSTAQLPQTQMKSTSVMMSSGSTLPQAATTGAVLTGETPGTYSSAGHHGHIRRGIDDDDENDKPSGWEDPYKDPIGDAWPLMLLACAYLIIRVGRARTRA